MTINKKYLIHINIENINNWNMVLRKNQGKPTERLAT